MPRSSGQSIPKYRYHRASGQAVCTICGHDYYLGPHGTKASKLEYDRLIAEWLASGRNPIGIREDELTVVELCHRYLKFASKYYRKDGRCTGEVPAIRAMIRSVRALYGRQPCAEFGPLALKAVRNQWVVDKLSRSYINAQAARIKRMFKWGASEQLVSGQLYQSLCSVDGLRREKSDAREAPPVLPVESELLEATLPFLPEVVADMVRLQRITGMRPAEICLLRPYDIDRTAEVWIYRPSSHKTEHRGRERIVPIGPRGQEILLRYLARDAKDRCFRPVDGEQKRRAQLHAVRKTPMSCGNCPGTNRKAKPKRTPGQAYDSSSYCRAIHRACDKAFPHPELGSKVRKDMTSSQIAVLTQWQSEHRWSPNQLRHAAATEIRKRFGLEAAQIILGHSQTDVTQVYAERDLEKGLEVARRIG